MRYCALIGSTSSCTPWFSTQKSPSSTFSSNVNPYWKPEHPPPETNTRSLRFGFASSRISSPTLPAAASVKTKTSGGGGAISDCKADSEVAFMTVVYSPASGQSKLRLARGTSITLAAPEVRPVDHLPVNLGADRGFNDRVPHISQHARLFAQLDPFSGVDIALDDAVEDDVGHD